MTQIPKMADHYIVYMDDIDGVTPMLFSMLVVVIGGDTCYEHITDLIFTRSLHHARIPAQRSDIVMTWMLMTDSDDGGVDLTQRREFCLRNSRLRGERVG